MSGRSRENSREKLPYWIAVAVLAVGLSLGSTAFGPLSVARAAAGGAVSVGKLTVDTTSDPLGIDDPKPGLGWQLDSTVNGERQSAYRVLVASSTGPAEPGAAADVWDSGQVASADSSACRTAARR